MTGVAFDDISLHPYALGPGTKLEKLNSARRQIKEAHETMLNRGIWITELGWPREVSNDPNVGNVSALEQGELLRGMFNWASQNVNSYNIKSLIWYASVDVNAGELGWAQFCGLRRQNGEFTPSYQEFVNQTGASLFTAAPTAFKDSAGNEHVFSSTAGGINHYMRAPGGGLGRRDRCGDGRDNLGSDGVQGLSR